MNRVAVVTGGTSGIGLATAKLLAARSWKVYVFSRREAVLEGLVHMSVDVTDESAVNEAVGRVIDREGQIDLLVNNAGFGISGAFEFTSSEDAHRLMEVNLFGMNNMIRAVLPHMRERGCGRIINLSSVAAEFPIQFQAWYSVSKAAVSALTMAVSNEVRPYGIKMSCVLPGDVKTGFTDARKKSIAGDDVYGGRITSSVAVMEKDERGGMLPESVAELIVKAATVKNPAPQYIAGGAYRVFCFLKRFLPLRLVRFVLEKMYK